MPSTLRAADAFTKSHSVTTPSKPTTTLAMWKPSTMHVYADATRTRQQHNGVSLPDSQPIFPSPSPHPDGTYGNCSADNVGSDLAVATNSNTEHRKSRVCRFIVKPRCSLGHRLTTACNGLLSQDISTHTLLSLLLPPFPSPPPPRQTTHTPPRFEFRALALLKDMDNARLPHNKHAPRRDHMKTHGVKLPNRGHNSAPVIRSRAGLGGADRVDD